MWRNPKFTDAAQPQPSGPPDETGVRLVTFPRNGREEFRVNLCEYEGHPFISLRVWAPGTDGKLWPIRGKGCSVRVKEIEALIRALTAGLAALRGDGADDDGRPSGGPQSSQGRGPGAAPVQGRPDPPQRTAGRQRGDGRPPWYDRAAGPQRPATEGTGDEFDEFGDGAR